MNSESILVPEIVRVRIVNEIGERTVILGPVHESDLDALFRQWSDPESVRMAAFTPENSDDRQRFDAHMVRVMESPENTLRAITWEGELVGSIASFVVEGQTEVTYWIDRAVWGRGIASRGPFLVSRGGSDSAPLCPGCEPQRRLTPGA